MTDYQKYFCVLKNTLPNCPAGLRGPGPGSAELRGLLHQRLGGGEPQVPAVQHQPPRRGHPGHDRWISPLWLRYGGYYLRFIVTTGTSLVKHEYECDSYSQDVTPQEQVLSC